MEPTLVTFSIQGREAETEIRGLKENQKSVPLMIRTTSPGAQRMPTTTLHFQGRGKREEAKKEKEGVERA